MGSEWCFSDASSKRWWYNHSGARSNDSFVTASILWHDFPRAKICLFFLNRAWMRYRFVASAFLWAYELSCNLKCRCVMVCRAYCMSCMGVCMCVCSSSSADHILSPCAGGGLRRYMTSCWPFEENAAKSSCQSWEKWPRYVFAELFFGRGIGLGRSGTSIQGERDSECPSPAEFPVSKSLILYF